MLVGPLDHDPEHVGEVRPERRILSSVAAGEGLVEVPTSKRGGPRAGQDAGLGTGPRSWRGLLIPRNHFAWMGALEGATFGVFSPAKRVHEEVFKVQNRVLSCHFGAGWGDSVWLRAVNMLELRP
jgi:hypothetical protein